MEITNIYRLLLYLLALEILCNKMKKQKYSTVGTVPNIQEKNRRKWQN
jgi:hypothetical protein